MADMNNDKQSVANTLLKNMARKNKTSINSNRIAPNRNVVNQRNDEASTVLNENIPNATSYGTVINENVRGNSSTSTVVNEAVTYGDNNSTVVNTAVGNKDYNATAINSTVNSGSNEIAKGTILLGKYEIDRVLSAVTGEAVLYVCNYHGEQYVAKVYRRAAAIKDNVINALKNIRSPYVARLYETGLWQGMPFEIIPYYRYGSIEGKTYTFEQLRQFVIPALNNGLKVLHDNNIIHKDLKPSNVMLTENARELAIIDFGISSFREEGKTVLVTKTGLTPDYSAPETFHGLFLEESDYYSLGITIYELYCGHTPYSGVSQEVLERYTSVQKLPFPENFPEKLKQLILGLTYTDISNRKDKNNPNRRWTYEEVSKWCSGKEIPVPGSGTVLGGVETASENAIPPITFMYNKYTDLNLLVNALGTDWNNGKKRLYRSALTEYFRKFDNDLANFCMDAEEAVQRDRSMADIEFFKCIYRLKPDMNAFYWNGQRYGDIVEVGTKMLEGAKSNDSFVLQLADEWITNHLFSIREGIVNRSNPGVARQLCAVEDAYLYAKRVNDYSEAYTQVFILAYYFTKSHVLDTSFGKFNTVEELTKFFKKVINNNPESLDNYSSQLILNNQVDGLLKSAVPQFRAWLIINGKGQLLN